MPGAPSSFLLLVAMPFVTSSEAKERPPTPLRFVPLRLAVPRRRTARLRDVAVPPPGTEGQLKALLRGGGPRKGGVKGSERF